MATVETVSISPSEDGALWRVTFGASTGNVLDANVMTALADVFHEAAAARHLKAICLEGRGEHFSYGASIQEHLPAEVAGMLDGRVVVAYQGQSDGAAPGTTDADMVELALWLKQNGFRADQVCEPLGQQDQLAGAIGGVFSDQSHGGSPAAAPWRLAKL